jgi:hypothetical protein
MPLDRLAHPGVAALQEDLMSSEPIATTTTAPADAALAAEKGLLIAVLLLVVFGVGAMLLMS